MDLKEIMSVSGYSGLFKFVSQGRNGIESFADQKRMFINATQKVSSLADIAIFTEEGEVPLKDVFKKINDLEPGQPAPEPKSDPDDLKKFMEKVLPEYDRNRVYVSDIKKLVSWYNSLLTLNLLSFEEEEKPAEQPAEAQPAADQAEPAAEKSESTVEKPKTPKTTKQAKPAGKESKKK